MRSTFGRRLALLVVTLVLPVAAPAAAEAAILYSTMEQPNDVQGINSDAAGPATWLAQSFRPTQSGAARVVSFFGQTQMGGGTGTATISIYSNNGGRPGTLLASGSGTVGEITGASPTCVVLGAASQLTAGGTYWAVFRGSEPISWLFSRNAAMNGLFSTNSGGTWSPRAHKTFSLRVETGPTCGPQIKPNPAPGAAIDDMYAKPNASSFNTVFIGNSGNQTLTLLGGSFSGPGAGSFRLLQGEPNGPANQRFEFPYTIGATPEAGAILYVTCDGALPQGQRTAIFTLTSNDPVQPVISWPVSCVVDATPPSLRFSQAPGGLGGWHVKTPARLTVTGVDPESGNRVVRIVCTDSLGGTFDFDEGSVAVFDFTTAGTHNLSCRGTDVAGNTSAAGAYTTTVRFDATAPDATRNRGPAALTTSTSAQFTWFASDAASGVGTVECSLDGGAYAACASGVTRTGLSEGQHTFDVRVRDVAGNYDATPARWTWRVDTRPPETLIGGGPSHLTKQTSAAFTVTASDGGGSGVSRVMCSLDGAAPAACPAPAAYAGLREGRHTLRAWAVDAAGNSDPTPDEVSWDIDLTAPTALITGHPAGSTTATTASFAFTAAEAGAAALERFECSLDGGPFAACASPRELTGLAAGPHTFEVRTIDVLANVQATATKFSWTVTVPPPPPPPPGSGPPPPGGSEPPPPGGGTSGGGTSGGGTSGGGTSGGGTTGGGSTGGGSTGTTATGDTTAPAITRARVKRRRLSFTLSEPARIVVVFRKRAGKATRRIAGTAGVNRVGVPKRLRKGRYRIRIVAVDAAGNASKPVFVKLRVR